MGKTETTSEKQTQPLSTSSNNGLERARDSVRRGVLSRRGKEEPGEGGSGNAGGSTVVNREARRPRSRLLTLALVIAVLLVSGALALNLTTGALDRLNPFKGMFGTTSVDRSGPAVLKSIQDLGQFEAASGYYELVVDVEKDVKPVPSFLAGQRTLFIAAGSVDIGVNLSNLGEGAVKVNGDRTHATIDLPAPTLSAPPSTTTAATCTARTGVCSTGCRTPSATTPTRRGSCTRWPRSAWPRPPPRPTTCATGPRRTPGPRSRGCSSRSGSPRSR